MSPYDAAVIGAGPAGLSTAIELLRKGWRVLILDKERLPREKVCGGFIGPENISHLEKYEILERLLSLGAHKVTSPDKILTFKESYNLKTLFFRCLRGLRRKSYSKMRQPPSTIVRPD